MEINANKLNRKESRGRLLGGPGRLLALAMTVLVLAAGGCRPERHAPSTPYDGIDISSHQAMIDWVHLSQDKYVKFVYIKATEGATYSSQHYGYNVQRAQRYNILVGSYHYFTTTATVARQFANFTELVPVGSQDLIPMIDVEQKGNWSRRQLCDSVAKFAAMVERHYGVKPMIYSTMSFYNDNLSPTFNNYPLYIGRYSDEPPTIDWNGRATIWQYSQCGVVDGIDAYVDLSLFVNGHGLDDIVMP